MTERSLRIAHLYPNQMNIYGDRGNMLSLHKRLEWRGLGTEVTTISPGAEFDPMAHDIIFGGGGQDVGQVVVSEDLTARRDDLRSAAEAGVVMLAICGTYQLFGHRFVTADGDSLAGIGLFDMETDAGDGRLIGNVVIDSDFGRLVGFENHGGRTHLASGQPALGQVVQGHGNNGESSDEGAIRHNVFGTYLHGPVLPKNPRLTDELLGRALARRYGTDDLESLDDRVEQGAAATAAGRPQ